MWKFLPALSAALLVLAWTLNARAEGPGSRIGTTPEIPLVTPSMTSPPDAIRCAQLAGARKARCLAELNTEPGRPATGPESVGPRSIGGASGSGASASSGTTGGASFGGSAPR